MPTIPLELRREVKRASPVLIAVPVTVLAIWGLGVLVIDSRVDAWDLDAIKWLADRRTPWLNRATEYTTYIAETIPVIVILLLAIVLARIWTREWRTSVFLAFVVGIEKVIYLVSAILVGRDRPEVPTLDETYATASFPSGHVGSAITLYGGIAIAVGAWRGRRHLVALMTVMVAFTAIVAFARMYRGFHYPTDCIAGALVGVVCLGVTTWITCPLVESRSLTAAADSESTGVGAIALP